MSTPQENPAAGFSLPTKQPQETVGAYMERAFSAAQTGPEPSSQNLKAALLQAYVAVTEPFAALVASFDANATAETQRRLHDLFIPRSLDAFTHATNRVTVDEASEAAQEEAMRDGLSHFQLTPEAALRVTTSLLEVRRQLLAHDHAEIERAAQVIREQKVRILVATDLDYQFLGFFSARRRQTRMQELRERVTVIPPLHTTNEATAMQIERLAFEAGKPGQISHFDELSQLFFLSLSHLDIDPHTLNAGFQLAIDAYYVTETQPQES